MVKVYIADLLACNSSDEEDDQEEEDTRTEWQKCCDSPQVSTKVNLLKWWKDNTSTFPCLSKMAMQVLACPACSSRVERLFSKAKLNHGRLQRSRAQRNYNE